MKHLLQILVVGLVILMSQQLVFGQISSPLAEYIEPTQYTNGMPDEEIFQTSNYEIGWDGSYKGVQAESANCSYQVKVVDFNNFNLEHYGHVTLTR